ncbi:site-specific integrase [Serinicoccus sp. CNJ-927]|uniref:site-specific integrase n=1 Tax=Serinicoccus sp. CNJ-927 TaxID=1904970 RepID=UPI0013018812|nr:site-specific integrase [Serinicoccus sp. CNJ-927]
MSSPEPPAPGLSPRSQAAADPLAVLASVPVTEELTDREAEYVAAARAQNTLSGYAADWREFTTWCGGNGHGHQLLPATPMAITRYLTYLAEHGAKTGTMSRRLSAIRFAHQLRELPDPTKHARVVAVWEGIRRVHGQPPVQSRPLMPPELFTVLDACPSTRTWADPQRPPEPHLGGARDRVLLLVGFVAALRRSELVGIRLEHLAEHPNGLVLTLPRSKTNQYGETAEIVVIPRGGNPTRCPVTAITTWRHLAGLEDPDAEGPLLRPVSKGNRALDRPLTAAAANTLITTAVARADLDPHGYTAHSLRAGFVTYAHLRGITDRAIAHQTRHRSLATLGIYTRIENAWTDNAATQLGL